MMICFLSSIALPVRHEVIGENDIRLHSTKPPNQYKFVYENDQHLPSPSYDKENFKVDNPFILEPSPSPITNLYDTTMPHPKNKYITMCLKEIEKTFSIWNNLNFMCKKDVYMYDHRWHDHAMRLERETAEMFCLQSERHNSVLRETIQYTNDMRLDIRNVILKSSICKYDELSKLSILYAKDWVETQINNWWSTGFFKLLVKKNTIPIVVTLSASSPVENRTAVDIINTDLGPGMDYSVHCSEYFVFTEYKVKCTLHTAPKNFQHICSQLKYTLSKENLSEYYVTNTKIYCDEYHNIP